MAQTEKDILENIEVIPTDEKLSVLISAIRSLNNRVHNLEDQNLVVTEGFSKLEKLVLENQNKIDELQKSTDQKFDAVDKKVDAVLDMITTLSKTVEYGFKETGDRLRNIEKSLAKPE